MEELFLAVLYLLVGCLVVLSCVDKRHMPHTKVGFLAMASLWPGVLMVEFSGLVADILIK